MLSRAKNHTIAITVSVSIYEAVIPAAVPQLGGTHQADEKTLSRTSGNRVIWRWTCSKFSTKANIAPIMNRTEPRTTRVVSFNDIAAPLICNVNI